MGITNEEAETFIKGFFNAFKGMEENFETTKKLAIERGWIQLDPYTDKRYFYPYFDEMNQMSKEALKESNFPDDYKHYSKEQKAEFKLNLYEEKPHIKQLWKDWSVHKGKLERASLNFRIQGNGATMSKLAMGLIDKDNNSLTEGLLLFVHDEAVEMVKEENAETASKRTIEMMRLAGTYTCKTVPMDAESAIGDSWIH